jgi:hypothetical protein
MKAFVAITSDVDCDGTAWAAHYFEGEKGNSDECQHIYNYSSYEFMTLTDFFSSDIWNDLDEWHKGYFLKEGYSSLVFHMSGACKVELGLPPYDDYEGGYPA